MATATNPCRDGHPEGAYAYWLHDARGIPVGKVCDRCEDHKRGQYRPDIFTDGSYWADEAIEGDY